MLGACRKQAPHLSASLRLLRNFASFVLPTRPPASHLRVPEQSRLVSPFVAPPYGRRFELKASALRLRGLLAIRRAFVLASLSRLASRAVLAAIPFQKQGCSYDAPWFCPTESVRGLATFVRRLPKKFSFPQKILAFLIATCIYKPAAFSGTIKMRFSPRLQKSFTKKAAGFVQELFEGSARSA